MPRLAPILLQRARRINALLPLLLRPCRDLESAQNELRWLGEYARDKIERVKLQNSSPRSTSLRSKALLKALCLQRSRGVPLQYILGTQPFGDLEVLVERGVLIPRLETESIITHLCALLTSSRPKIARNACLRVLDLCTGTGCIALLSHTLLSPHHPNLQIQGIDISPAAIMLSRENLLHNQANENIPTNCDINFSKADIFAPTFQVPQCDILISNPPYISPASYNNSTSRSVRNHEPKRALVPSFTSSFSAEKIQSGDEFYPHLIDLAKQSDAQILLFEVADLAQALRVAGMIVAESTSRWVGCEIWRDWPDQTGEMCHGGDGTATPVFCEISTTTGTRSLKVRGTGNGRAVFAWTALGYERYLNGYEC